MSQEKNEEETRTRKLRPKRDASETMGNDRNIPIGEKTEHGTKTATTPSLG